MPYRRVVSEAVRYACSVRGWSYREFSSAAVQRGLSAWTLRDVFYGRRRVLRESTALRILQVFADHPPRLPPELLGGHDPGPMFPLDSRDPVHDHGDLSLPAG